MIDLSFLPFNFRKAIFDALQDAGVYEDDSQIDYFAVLRLPPKKGGYCNVVIVEEPSGKETDNA